MTSTVPVGSAGLTAVMDVELMTVKLVAAIVPNFTAVIAAKLEPVIVTVVPPAVGPLVTERLETDGTTD